MELKKRLRKLCPECNSLRISFRSKRIKPDKKYKCRSCKAEFEIPGARVVQHREIALRRY